MASINFPESLNMAAKSPAAPADPLITRYRSDNPSYAAGDIIRIEIPTGGRNQYLLPTDSFLSFDYTSTHTIAATSSTLRLDGSTYSIFRRARVIHGSTTLVDVQHVGRLWNALRDVMVPTSARPVDEIRLGADSATNQTNVNNYNAGLTLVSGSTYDSAFPLPLPLIGTLSKSAVPLGLAGASSLFIELEIAPHAQIVTTRIFGTPQGAAGDATALTLTSFVVSNIYYNAKIVTLEEPYNQALMSVYAGKPLMLPAVDYLGEMKVIPTGASAINEKFAFSRSSVNGILWFLANSDVANGVITAFDLAEGTTHRQGGPLSEYAVALSGKNLLPIYCGASGTAGFFKGAVSVNQIGRIYNNMNSVDGMGVLNFRNYSSQITTYADAIANSKRFVGAYSLERYDADSKYASGSNLLGQDVRLTAVMTTGLTESNNLYAYCMCDVGFELIDGQFNLRS
jgi:hypothetical protein